MFLPGISDGGGGGLNERKGVGGVKWGVWSMGMANYTNLREAKLSQVEAYDPPYPP